MQYENKETLPKEWGEWLEKYSKLMPFQSLYENFRVHFKIRNMKRNQFYGVCDWFGAIYLDSNTKFHRHKICFKKKKKKLGLKIKKVKDNKEIGSGKD